MTNKEKNDIISAWNEIEESIQNLDVSINAKTICKADKAILEYTQKRLKKALELLGEHFTDDEAQYAFNQQNNETKIHLTYLAPSGTIFTAKSRR